MAQSNTIRMNAGSLQATITSLRKAGTAANSPKVFGRAFVAAGEELTNEVRKNISLTDHSLADLAAMDHPYARRHGTIRIHRTKGGRMIDEPTSLVHTRSGRMKRSLKGRWIPRRGVYQIRFDTNIAKHAKFVVQGTRVMLPRDPIWHTANDPAARKMMMRTIVRVLGRDLRTQSAIRFGTQGRPPSMTPVSGASGGAPRASAPSSRRRLTRSGTTRNARVTRTFGSGA